MHKRVFTVVTIIATFLLLFGLSYWANHNDGNRTELKVDEQNEYVGPFTPEEQAVIKPSNTNDMNPKAIFTTNKGVIEVELYQDLMPVTVQNFIQLAEADFYNDTKFHRVISGFMIQGGDPNTRTDNESIYGTGGPEDMIPDEFVTNEKLTNERGTIAMANTGQPNSGGSQWFINLTDNTGLDFDKAPLTSKHPVFGRVVNGMDVVDVIAQVETKERDIPVEPVIITSIHIEQ